MVKKLLGFAENSIGELSQRMSSIKGLNRDSISVDKDLKQAQKDLATQKSAYEEKIFQLQRQLQRETEEKKTLNWLLENKMKDQRSSEQYHKEYIANLEKRIEDLEAVQHNKIESDSKIQSLKTEIRSQDEQILNLKNFNTNYQTIHDNQVTEIEKLKLEVKECRYQLEEKDKKLKGLKG